MNAFNLESQIAEWRKRIELNHQESLDELESHLRDEIARLRNSGLSEKEQFRTAVESLGKPEMLKEEFAKLNRQRFWNFWRTPSIALKVLGAWFVLMGLSGLSFLPPISMENFSVALTRALICMGLCGAQIVIGIGLMRRTELYRWYALGWIALFFAISVSSLHPLNGMLQHLIYYKFQFGAETLSRIESLSRWQLVFFTRFADFRHVTDFLSPAILVWGAWLLTRPDTRQMFNRDAAVQTT